MLFSRDNFWTQTAKATEKHWFINLIEALITYPLVRLFNYIVIRQLLSEEYMLI